MKKKVRIYKNGGKFPSYLCGGSKMSNKEMGGESTQDSQLDKNIPQKKAVDFLSWLQNKSAEARTKTLDINQGLPMAQTGLSYPNYDVFEPIVPTNQEQFMLEGNNPVMELQEPSVNPWNYQMNNVPPLPPGEDYSEYTSDPNANFEDDNEFRIDSPYALPTGIIAGMQAASYIGNLDDRYAQEAAIRERVSNIHRFQSPIGSDRGDYMVNVPGVGDFLKPDQHVRKGYGTKIAEMGYEINDEVELSEDDIEKLIAQGYDLEYLD